MKQELEAEYLATFKKTVAMHETFVCRYQSNSLTCINPWRHTMTNNAI